MSVLLLSDVVQNKEPLEQATLPSSLLETQNYLRYTCRSCDSRSRLAFMRGIGHNTHALHCIFIMHSFEPVRGSVCALGESWVLHDGLEELRPPQRICQGQVALGCICVVRELFGPFPAQ